MESRTGTTTKQMIEAVGGAIYIWPESGSLKYAINLADSIGRNDLQIYCASDLHDVSKFRGVDVFGLVIDHAVFYYGLSQNQKHTLDIIASRIRSIEP